MDGNRAAARLLAPATDAKIRSIGIVHPTMMLDRLPALRTEFALIRGID
jgi:hypothetical protein